MRFPCNSLSYLRLLPTWRQDGRLHDAAGFTSHRTVSKTPRSSFLRTLSWEKYRPFMAIYMPCGKVCVKARAAPRLANRLLSSVRCAMLTDPCELNSTGCQVDRATHPFARDTGTGMAHTNLKRHACRVIGIRQHAANLIKFLFRLVVKLSGLSVDVAPVHSESDQRVDLS